MKKTIIFAIFLLMLSSAFAQTKGIVTGNNVRIRNTPGVQGAVVAMANQNQVIDILEYAGTGTMNDGVWDFWARIGDQEWINASWIFETPFYFIHEEEIDEDLIEVSEIHDDGTFHIRNLSYRPAFENDVTSKSIQLDERNLRRGTYLAANFYRFYFGRNRFTDVIMHVVADENMQDEYDEWNTTYAAEGISVTIIPEMNNAVDTAIITDPDITLFFGVKVGMKKDQLLEILGTPNPSDDTEVLYRGPSPSVTRLSFQIADNTVTAIHILSDR
ncbi:MAG: hypothetical protein MJ178_03110 [Treponemataceae bacterium]|nr:hypothetical protein [Treponemataceae bacterium]